MTGRKFRTRSGSRWWFAALLGLGACPLPPGPASGAAPAQPDSGPPVVTTAARAGKLSSPAKEEAAVQIGIAYGTEKRRWLEEATRDFAQSAAGRHIRIELIPMGSVESAHAIVDGDRRIHVWSPASSLYRSALLRDWAARHRGNPLRKEEALALTPMVLVMWKSRYEAFTRKSPQVSLRTIAYAMQAKTGWGRIAEKPEWGVFKFSHTHPDQSNSGLLTLVLLAHDFCNKHSALTVDDVASPAFHRYLARFERGVTGLSNSTGNLMKEMLAKGPASCDALMVYESVALEHLAGAEGRWEPLQVIYPPHNLWNDNPYCVLQTPWTTPAHQAAAETFLSFLLSEPIQERALEHGFRPGNPSVPLHGPDSPFVKFRANGVRVELPEMCEVPPVEVIENLQQAWLRNAVPR